MNIKELNGIGDKTEKIFNQAGIFTSKDLLRYYPRTYDRFETAISINEAINKKGIVSIEGVVIKSVELIHTKSFVIAQTFIRDSDANTIKLIWYRMPFIKNVIKLGNRFVFRGVINYVRNQYILEHPAYYTPNDYATKTDNLWPVYNLVKGLTNNMVSKAVKQTFELENIEDTQPSHMLDKYQLMPLADAMYNMHFPENKDIFIDARRRLVFDEFFNFIKKVKHLKNEKQPNAYKIKFSEDSRRLIESLPFKLTDSQLKVIDEIDENRSGDTAMNRLIQGDVGSGKTIIALIAMLNAAAMSYQSAIMAPTEVLATQHYETFDKLLKAAGISVKIVLLTGSMTAKEKKNVYEQIASNEAKIIIGTHALFQEKVEYANLALVVTDEQHRFGVKQRDTLANKGDATHVIIMSATPIPRTLSQIIYCDYDLSVIYKAPSTRLPIKNCVVNTDYRAKAYSFIEKEINKGHQAYVICPLATDSENFEGENVIDYAKKLQNEFADNVVIEHLHGKMKPEEKNEIMQRFATGQIHILVSTTVIEVGVNVPNATVMLVENAERFGLATLHQLRGRVGRGEAQSYCIFMSGSGDASKNERLNILNKSNDGFYIAQKDMKLRGPGDIFGIRQSGEMLFELADIYADADLLYMANEAVESMEE